MNPNYYGENEDKIHYQQLETLTDRELQEKQAFLQSKILGTSLFIRNILLFFLILTILGLIMTFKMVSDAKQALEVLQP